MLDIVSRRRSEAIAFGTIRVVAALTIAILVLIIGFVFLKGLRYSNETRSSVLPYAEEAPDGLVVAVNGETKLDVIEFPVLLGMFSDEYLNWAKINGEDHDLVPLALDPAGPEGAAAESFLFGAVPLWGGLVETLPDPAVVIAKIAATPGAVAVLPASAVRKGAAKDSGIRTVPVRRLVLAASREVSDLVENHSVSDVSDASIRRVLSGEYSSWSELQGPELPICLVAPPAGSSLSEAVRAAGYETAASPVSSPAADMDSYIASIAGKPGAAGFIFASDASAAGLPALVRLGRERGWNLTPRYLFESPRLSGKVGGISTIIANTFLMLFLTVLLAAPLGVAAAVYLVEYAKQGFLIRVLRLGTETLAGIPSILFGLFGMLFFVDLLGFGFGLLSGCLTLTLMILPTIVRTSEEALKAVPMSLREGSLALGATKLQTILRVAIPAAAPGVLTGLILGIGRAVGETAALLFTMGSDYKLAKGLFSSARALSTHIYLLFAEGISFDRAFSTATVLILVVLLFNFAAKHLVGRMGRHAAQ